MKNKKVKRPKTLKSFYSLPFSLLPHCNLRA